MSEIKISSRDISRYSVYGKNRIAKALNLLVAAGWLERHTSHHAGRYEPDTFVIIEHAEWAERHPGGCDKPVPLFGTED